MKKKATKAERTRLVKAVKRMTKDTDIVIGNPAVVEKKTPYVEVFDNRKVKSKWGPGRAGFVLSWDEPGKGFGQITFIEKDGHFEIETECMGIQFVIRQVVKMLANAKVVE